MKAMIRLQNHGDKHHRFWWIVIQGSKTNQKGRFVEHVGYYLPFRGKTVQRSLIFNKPRIRYWLAVGATPSRAVHKLLSYIDYMPKIRPPFGFKYTYEKKEKSYKKPAGIEKLQLTKQTKKFYEHTKNKNELNMLERELRTQNEIDKQVRNNEDIEDIELVDSDIEDERVRTKTFTALKTKFVEYENDVSKLNTRKREMLFRKMNKLASKGLISDAELNAIDPEKDSGLYGTTTEERIEKHAKFAQLMEKKREQYERVIKHEEMLKPISQDDFVNYILEHSNMSAAKVKREADNFFSFMKKTGRFATRQDAFNICNKLPRIKWNAHEVVKGKGKNLIVPTTIPITPFPDLKTFDPESYYDTKLGPHSPDNPNKAYNALRYKANIDVSQKPLYRKKQNKGRKTHVRLNFSTTNTCSTRISFCAQDSLTFAYTGLMKKISST